jgi:DNA-binding transcriptional LysR family regulator
MDFRHVRAFIAVADTLSVTKAAERLHISQPPLSRHIHQLEEELGTMLFVRHHHGVTLTESGRLLLEKARILEAAATEFYDTAQRASRGDLGTIRVGIGWGLWDVANKVRVEFAKRRPAVTIEAHDAFCADDANERLRSQKLDLVFGRAPFDGSVASVRPMYEERLRVAIGDANPLASRTSLSLRDLGTQTVLLWDRHVAPALYDKIQGLFAHAGITPVMAPTPGAGPFNNAGLMLVASGRGCYVCLGVPLTSAHGLSGVVDLPLSDEEATSEVCVASRRDDASPLVAEFLDCVQRLFPRDEHELAPVPLRSPGSTQPSNLGAI